MEVEVEVVGTTSTGVGVWMTAMVAPSGACLGSLPIGRIGHRL
ncbi:hypothetical protein [Streptomyces sp. NPDC058955]